VSNHTIYDPIMFARVRHSVAWRDGKPGEAACRTANRKRRVCETLNARAEFAGAIA
jgi:hypothetical protein